MIDYLSYSSINLYLTCSESWRRKYLNKEPQITTPALLFGSAIHSTIEAYIANRYGDVQIDTDIQTLWSGNWQAALEREPDCEWGADTPEFHHNEGVRLLGNPELMQTLDRLNPLVDDDGLYMERKVELRVPGVPVPIIGYIDLVTRDGIPHDFKTSKYAWSQDKAREEIQPLFYVAAMNQMGMPSPGMRFRHIVVTKAKQSKVQVIEVQHTIDALFFLFELIQKVWKAIESEAFVMNPNAWLCSPKYCSFYSTCRGKGL
jgi:putative RecB family exonuclease